MHLFAIFGCSCVACDHSVSLKLECCDACVAYGYKHHSFTMQVPHTPFTKLMAANRGEIAVRIIRAGIELGVKTVRAKKENRNSAGCLRGS
jgi:hypothetical protein